MIQEIAHLGRIHLPRMALAVEQDVASNPVDVGLLRARAIMTNTNGGPDLVQQW